MFAAFHRQSLTNQILLAMAAAIVTGVLLNAFAAQSAFIQDYVVGGLFHIGGKAFVNLLQMIVVPLVFFSLICGIIGMDDIKTLGRTGLKTVFLFLLTTGIAITIALSLAGLLGIGEDFAIESQSAAAFAAKEAPALTDVIINLFPKNIPAAMADGNMLQIIVASIFIGIAMMHAGAAVQPVADLIYRFNDIMMALVTIIMALAPYGVFCLLAKTFAQQGIDLILPMAGYFFVILGALVLHAIVTYGGLVTLAGLNPMTFFKKMRRVQVFAFSTASSNATIPVNLKNTESRLGVHNSLASFTIPFGATINMDGTAIMQGCATVFIANVYGIDLSLADYVTVIGMAVLASIGTAGVPGVGLIMLTMVFNQVGLPVEGIALIIGVDRLLDMARTAINVTGDAAVTAVVAKSEGKLDLEIFADPEAGLDEEEQTLSEHYHYEEDEPRQS